MAAASSRRPRRTLAIWGLVVLVALVLVGTSLKGLTTSAYVVGTTQSSQAKALYDQAIGAAAGQKPTDVIVVSSSSVHGQSPSFQSFVEQLEDKVRTNPGITNVTTDLNPGSPLVSSNDHAVAHPIAGGK